MFGSIEEAIAFAKNTDDGGVPFFRYEAVKIPHSDPAEYEDQVWVKIINKGDPKSIMDRPKRKEDEARWPAQWAAWQKGEEAPLNGIPLKEYPALSPAQVKNCQALNIRTVEDLANFPDGQIDRIKGQGYAMKKAAAKFLEYRKGPDVSELMNRIKELEKQVGDNTQNGAGRSGGDGVSKADNANRKQQPGRKKRGGSGKQVNKEPAEVSVDGATAGA
jgi:hypothetical protein